MGDFTAIEAFRPLFNTLAWIGYLKIIIKEVSPRKRLLHNIYRGVVTFFVLLYNLQHLINAILNRQNTDRLVDTLFIFLTTLSTLMKQIAFNFNGNRITEIVRVIKGHYFASNSPYQVKLIKANALMTHQLLKLYFGAVFTCGTFWTIFPFVNRANGKDVHFSAYFPIETSSSLSFQISVAYLSILIVLQAFGNVTMDCTIITFYTQPKLQLEILRDNLEHLLEPEDQSLACVKSTRNKLFKRDTSVLYKDISDQAFGQVIQKRLVNHVEHYKKIVWLINEVEDIFSEALFFQLLVTAWVICMTAYKIIDLSLMSVEFVSMLIYLCCMMVQFFFYCYFGSLLKVESELVNGSIYSSEWLSVSPRFRRQLVIMMVRGSRSLNPRIAGIVPISLETFIAVLKSSYTLLTFLKSQK